MPKTTELDFQQRIWAVAIYASLLFGSLYFIAGGIGPLLDETTAFNKILVSGGLLLIFGAYIAEPFFTKPTDVLVNATGITLFLLGIDSDVNFIGREALLYYAGALIALSIVFLLSTRYRGYSKVIDSGVRVLVLLGQSRVAYSAIYLATLVTYFQDNKVQFATLLTFWAIFISGFLVEGLILYLSRLWLFLNKEKSFVGRVIGRENAFVLKIEAEKKSACASVSIGDLIALDLDGQKRVGIIVQKNSLMNREWILAYLLTTSGVEISDRETTTSVGTPEHLVSKINLSDLSGTLSTEVQKNELYKSRNQIAGYVLEGSNINKIKFRVFASPNGIKVSEGTIVSSSINGASVLFQVLDGVTQEEELNGHDQDTYITGIARKLGIYNRERKEIDSAKWVPPIYSPIYILEDKQQSVTDTDIGELPGTDFALQVADYNALITHNTAILGILGVGKSCLTFELIQKILKNTKAKVICLDITGQYQNKKEGLPRYIDENEIDTSLVSTLNAELSKAGIATKDASEDGGNIPLLRELLSNGIKGFLDSDKHVLIVSPEEVSAIRQKDDIKKRTDASGKWVEYAPFAELSIAETTRLISEAALAQCRETGMQKEARLLLVYEEAHSLIPEWNSAANEGDKTASNGTARVVLQGRKYGLGSFVITQRTANISKSILNQCNTIFALRVFDDTGKQFLENYIGPDFSGILPALEDRHAVLVGKALKLKQPVIAQLNDRKVVMREEKEEDARPQPEGGGIVPKEDQTVVG